MDPGKSLELKLKSPDLEYRRILFSSWDSHGVVCVFKRCKSLTWIKKKKKKLSSVKKSK